MSSRNAKKDICRSRGERGPSAGALRPPCQTSAVWFTRLTRCDNRIGFNHIIVLPAPCRTMPTCGPGVGFFTNGTPPFPASNNIVISLVEMNAKDPTKSRAPRNLRLFERVAAPSRSISAVRPPGYEVWNINNKQRPVFPYTKDFVLGFYYTCFCLLFQNYYYSTTVLTVELLLLVALYS